jgi:hypothetical protein
MSCGADTVVAVGVPVTGVLPLAFLIPVLRIGVVTPLLLRFSIPRRMSRFSL